jgi:hypothetical protein
MLSVSTDKADISFDEDCLVRICIHRDAELEKEDMVNIVKAKFSLTGDKKHIVLFIPGTDSTISEEARKISASVEHNRNAIAKAILVSAMHQRIIGNFFIKFNRPPVPTAVFDNEKEALEWLEKMRHTEESA